MKGERKSSTSPKRRRRNKKSESSGQKKGKREKSFKRQRSISTPSINVNNHERSGSDDVAFCMYLKLLEENKRLTENYRTDALIIHLLGKMTGDQKMIMLKFIMKEFPTLQDERNVYIRNYSPRFRNVLQNI